jgi:PAS domain S-box-containing protein
MNPKTIRAASGGRQPELYLPLWFRVSTLFLLVGSILLLGVVLGDRVYTSHLAVVSLVAVLVALGCAVLLHLRAWYIGRKEFNSVYEHVLDGIFLLDDRGILVDANPAALRLLRSSADALLGLSFGRFYCDPRQFERQWQEFLATGAQRGQLALLCPDGGSVYVRYTAYANHLPGRHMLILCDITERLEAQSESRVSQERLRQVTDNIHEIVWMMDASTKQVIEINRAYETITGRSLASIEQDPSSYRDLIHPADREVVLAKLEDAVRTGHFDEEFRIIRPDGEIRWVWVKASPIPRHGTIRLLVGTAQDITAKKLAASQIAEHLAAAECARVQADLARGEAEALRKATLAITQNLRMDVVLDTLLRCVFEIIPYDAASVLFTEENGGVFVARQAPLPPEERQLITLELTDNTFLQRVVIARKNLHLADTQAESDWRAHRAFPHTRSWLAVPLISADAVLGLLSISKAQPGFFTTEHFRMAKSLAIPAAVAIQNARLYEWAAIYAAERKTLLQQIHKSQKRDETPGGFKN